MGDHTIMVRTGRGSVLRGLPAACHPLPTVAVTAITTALAAACGHTWRSGTLVALAVLAGQLSIGWSNDWLDARRDLAAGRADKPVVAGATDAGATRLAAFAALAACVGLSVACGPLAAVAHLVAVAAAWLYNLGVKGTRWSWLPYAVSFGLLPAVVTLALPHPAWPAWWAPVAGALLGVGAHLANVLPDIADDLATGVRGLPQRLGATRVRALAPLPVLAATVVIVLGPPGTPGAVEGVVLAAGALLLLASVARPGRSGDGRDEVPFRACVAVAAIDVCLLFFHAGALS